MSGFWYTLAMLAVSVENLDLYVKKLKSENKILKTKKNKN